MGPPTVAAYQRQIAAALDRALRRVGQPEPLDVGGARLVIFSDHHKGAGDKADDFRDSAPAYGVALAYYLEQGYSLYVLGDVEELWECRAETVLRTYPHIFRQEAQFQRLGRYQRFWGNHDDLWRHEGPVERILAPVLGGGLRVREGVRYRVSHGATELGELVLLHGHQGDDASDVYAAISKHFVRFVWRPIQRLTSWGRTTPAKDYALREQHDTAMYLWARSVKRRILVAGHTHRPVFESKTEVGRLQEQFDALRFRLAADPTSEILRAQVREAERKLETAKEKQSQSPEGDPSDRRNKPCYFNVGCCSFRDGDITGIEIDSGHIRLVKWARGQTAGPPEVKEEARLDSTFAQL